MLPLQASENGPQAIIYHRMERIVTPNGSGPDAAAAHSVMLLRGRKSRIYYLRRFFDYPISLRSDTLLKLVCGEPSKSDSVIFAARCFL